MEDYTYFGRRMRVTAVGPSSSLQWAAERGFDGWYGLKMTFRAEKTDRVAPNKAKLTIYNLSPASRAFLADAERVIVEAGYEAQLSTWFVGDISEMKIERRGVDVHTILELGDGEEELTKSMTSVSFTPGATVDDIIERLQADLGIRIGMLSLPETFAIEEPISFVGRTQDVLSAFGAYADAWISVQDGELQITPQGSTTGEEAVLISSDTGMIGSPVAQERVWNVRSLLNPGLRPRRLVEVRARDVSGVGIIRKVGVDLDTHGTSWHCDLEVDFDG